jgi:threonine dehydrogenase-like Zn-dependent dehydrogenase
VTAYDGLVARARVHPAKRCSRTPFEASGLGNIEVAGYVNTTQKEWCDKIREMTGGKGVGVAFDCVGGGLGTNWGDYGLFLAHLLQQGVIRARVSCFVSYRSVSPYLTHRADIYDVFLIERERHRILL